MGLLHHDGNQPGIRGKRTLYDCGIDYIRIRGAADRSCIGGEFRVAIFFRPCPGKPLHFLMAKTVASVRIWGWTHNITWEQQDNLGTTSDLKIKPAGSAASGEDRLIAMAGPAVTMRAAAFRVAVSPAPPPRHSMRWTGQHISTMIFFAGKVATNVWTRLPVRRQIPHLCYSGLDETTACRSTATDSGD